MPKITITNTILTAGESKDGKNWEQEELQIEYSVIKTEDGFQPVVELMGKCFPKSEIQRVLSIMDKVEELSEIVGEGDV